MFVKSKMFTLEKFSSLQNRSEPKVKNWLVKKYPWANSSSSHRDLLFNFFVFFPFFLFLCVRHFILCNFLFLFSLTSPFLLFHSSLQLRCLSFFSLFILVCHLILCNYLFLFLSFSHSCFFTHLFH